MEQFSTDAQLIPPPPINNVVKFLIWVFEEIKRYLDEMSHMVNVLLHLYSANPASEFHDPFAPGNAATLDGSTSPLAQTPVQDDPIDLGGSDLLEVVEENHPWDPDLVALPPPLGDLYTLSGTTSVSMMFQNDTWVPPTPRPRTISLPPVDPSYETWDDGGGDEGDYDGGPYYFPGGGINSHQSTQQWTSASTQDAEASTSLADAKPGNI